MRVRIVHVRDVRRGLRTRLPKVRVELRRLHILALLLSELVGVLTLLVGLHAELLLLRPELVVEPRRLVVDLLLALLQRCVLLLQILVSGAHRRGLIAGLAREIAGAAVRVPSALEGCELHVLVVLLLLQARGCSLLVRGLIDLRVVERSLIHRGLTAAERAPRASKRQLLIHGVALAKPQLSLSYARTHRACADVGQQPAGTVQIADAGVRRAERCELALLVSWARCDLCGRASLRSIRNIEVPVALIVEGSFARVLRLLLLQPLAVLHCSKLIGQVRAIAAGKLRGWRLRCGVVATSSEHAQKEAATCADSGSPRPKG